MPIIATLNTSFMKKNLEFLPQIDGLRFIAVLGVIIAHWVAQSFTGSVILGNIPYGTGVNLFFVISGFLITYILLLKKDDIANKESTFKTEIKNFYVKRTLRIFPIYYLLILILCIVNYEEIRLYLIDLLTYTSNWYMVLENKYIGHQTHLWSLAVEEQFYLVWPFCILLVPKKRILLTIFLFILIGFLSKIFFLFFTSHVSAVNGATFSCFDSLGFGALIAYNQIHKVVKLNIKYVKILLWSSILVYILLYVSPGLLKDPVKFLLFNSMTSVVFFFMIFIAANNGYTGFWKAILENKSVLYLGRISYGMYLYHNFIPLIYFAGLNKFFPGFKTDFDLFVIYFLMLVIISTVSWYLIERPLLSLKKRFQ
ncbi:MAG: acyltransferase 3 [Bacteroidetes bacterium]|jgi:peptidoglycan/LPS O-acetylase OafA/YrhL|nr:acyltransferase 3 [Bacteroidota bacterium]